MIRTVNEAILLARRTRLAEVCNNAAHLPLLCLLVLPLESYGHHSFSATFDGTRFVELDGEVTVTRVYWGNPHVRFSVTDDSNPATTWEIETDSYSTFRQTDIGDVRLEVGDRIRLAGNPTRRSSNRLWATNILIPDGRELVLGSADGPRWSDEILGRSGPEFATEGEAARPELGIFKVWTSSANIPMLLPESVDASFDLNTYPLTDAARRTIAAFDPERDNPTANCTPKGMPTIMEQPYPMEFSRSGSDIVLRMEEYETVRTIHMGSDIDGEVEPSRLGYSVGSLDGDTLVVNTSRINWGHFDQSGIPLSEAAEIVEYFTPNDDGDRLEYRMIVTDPETFTEPVELEKYWFHIPGVSVGSYECVDP